MRYLCDQYTGINGRRVPLFAGVSSIFGHGNLTCLSEALAAVQDQLSTWRGRNEQLMPLQWRARVANSKACQTLPLLLNGLKAMTKRL